jgi:hypothetical protein
MTVNGGWTGRGDRVTGRVEAHIWQRWTPKLQPLTRTGILGLEPSGEPRSGLRVAHYSASFEALGDTVDLVVARHALLGWHGCSAANSKILHRKIIASKGEKRSDY